MKFKIRDASGDGKPCSLATNRTKDEHEVYWYEVEVNTLEDLLAIIEERNEDLILSRTHIRVYDDWME